MLSLTSGTPIAYILKEKEPKKDWKKIFIKGDVFDDSQTAELDTTQENKERIFKDYLKMDKKLNKSDIDRLVSEFKSGKEQHEGKLSRKYDEANEYVNTSLKKYLDYGDTEELFPIVEDLSKKSVRIFISGQSNSGKSYFISQFLKYNKPKKSQGVFIFSPFKEDKSLKDIKNLIYLDLDEFEKEFKTPFQAPEDIPPNSIVIFDDIESHTTRAKELMKIRDIFLERGRHHGLEQGGGGTSVLTISHNPLGHNKTKASIRESTYAVVFPRANPRDTGALLQKYFGYTKKMIDEIMNAKTRWCFVSKSVPQYWVSQHSVRLM
jgi:hypothetical protein